MKYKVLDNKKENYGTGNGWSINYDQTPSRRITSEEVCAWSGYQAFIENLRRDQVEKGKQFNSQDCNIEKTILVIDCYPGVDQEEILEGFQQLAPSLVLHSDECAWAPEEMDIFLETELTEDPVFGVMTSRSLVDFFRLEDLNRYRERIQEQEKGWILIYGVGASLITCGDILIYADMPRWEIQLRYRNGMPNWRSCRRDAPISEKFKRGYFAEWRWADQHKKNRLKEVDYILDSSRKQDPSFVTAAAFWKALEDTVTGPFRLVPYFDPGVWGGNWMKERFGLKENGTNYAWSFDGVPEENSLRFIFGDVLIEIPAMDLVLFEPVRLLGKNVYDRFGAEFPIRFDLLDTIGGENLSLQVHPSLSYIRKNFNMPYTQDESYYILDTEQEESYVYLGVKEGAESNMEEALQKANNGDSVFDAGQYVNRLPVKKHDHILIPAGTVHGSGAGTMVLEISATPYIFTFKLWDWGRNGLDGRPRPVHIEHGIHNICWDRDEIWVRENLCHQETLVQKDANVFIERTGLHDLEFIETFRYTVYQEAEVPTEGTVNVLNLVEGAEVIICSSEKAFEPFTVHYAETFIVPACVKAYKIIPAGSERGVSGGTETLKAFPERSGNPVKLIMARVRVADTICE